jgi:hypothetical protein
LIISTGLRSQDTAAVGTLRVTSMRDKRYRDEQGVLLRTPAMIDRKFSELLQ